MQRFRPSARSYGEGTTLLTTAIASAAGASAGASAGGAAAAASPAGGHIDPNGFLGLNWKAIGASVLVGTLVAIGTDVTLTFLKPRLFGERRGKA
jgi:hypothetical protein